MTLKAGFNVWSVGLRNSPGRKTQSFRQAVLRKSCWISEQLPFSGAWRGDFGAQSCSAGDQRKAGEPGYEAKGLGARRTSIQASGHLVCSAAGAGRHQSQAGAVSKGVKFCNCRYSSDAAPVLNWAERSLCRVRETFFRIYWIQTLWKHYLSCRWQE